MAGGVADPEVKPMQVELILFVCATVDLCIFLNLILVSESWDQKTSSEAWNQAERLKGQGNDKLKVGVGFWDVQSASSSSFLFIVILYYQSQCCLPAGIGWDFQLPSSWLVHGATRLEMPRRLWQSMRRLWQSLAPPRCFQVLIWRTWESL